MDPGKQENSQVREHILVCLSSAPSNANLIRTAARMAGAFGATFTALYVQTSGTQYMSPENRQRLQGNIRLAEKLGAVITTVSGEDVPYQIAAFARLSGVTKLVIGRSGMKRRTLFGDKPLTEKLIEQTPNLDIYIIPDMQGENRTHRSPLSDTWRFPNRRQWGMLLGILAAATGTGVLFGYLGYEDSNIAILYVLAVLLTALFTKSYLSSVICSLASVLLFGFLFAEPRFSIQADSGGYLVTFLIMVAASLVAGTLANRLADNARQMAESTYLTRIMLETNQLLQKAGDDGEILRLTARQLLKLLHRDLVLFPVREGKLAPGLPFSPEENREPLFFGEPEIARWAFENRARAGAGTEKCGTARGQYLPIRSNGDPFGVVGIHLDGKHLEPFENSVLLSILGECALAMESSRNAREKEAAAVLAKNEQLRSDLLRTISHDLRTPLTSISGNAETLLNREASLDPETRREVLTDIYDDAVWLTQLVENLLSITRIGEGRIRLNCSAQLVDEVVTESLRHLDRRAEQYTVTARVADELLLANMDARLISQVIVNLVDNAIKYTPAGSEITVSAELRGNMAAISVTDNGPGIPDSAKAQVFDMFYTGNARVADCRRSLGLGLPLCRSIVRAHGGEITLEDNRPSGCVFTFTIPASEVTINA